MGSRRKGQLFIVSVVFMIGMVFVVQQALFNYSSVDMSEPFGARDAGVFQNVLRVVNGTMSGSYYCNETTDSFKARMDELKASFLEEHGREYSIEILYTLDCARWENAPPAPAPFNVSIVVTSRDRDTRGAFNLYHAR